MLDPGLADDILEGFTRALFAQIAVLQGDAFWLVGQLAQWYMILIVLPLMMAGMFHALPMILQSLAKVSMMFWLVQNFQRIAQIFLNYVVGAGLLSTGSDMTPGQFLSPSTVLFHGFNITLPMIKYLEDQSLWGKVTNLGLGAVFQVSTAFTAFMFMCIAAHVMVLVIVFEVLVVMSMITVPWILFKPTASFGMSSIHDLLKQGMRLGSLAAVTGAMLPMLQWLAFRPGFEPTFWTVLSQAFGAFVFALISISVPWLMSLHGGLLIGAATGMILGAGRRVMSRV